MTATRKPNIKRWSADRLDVEIVLAGRAMTLNQPETVEWFHALAAEFGRRQVVAINEKIGA